VKNYKGKGDCLISHCWLSFPSLSLLDFSSYLTGATTIGSGFHYLRYSAFEKSGNSTSGDSSKDSAKEPDSNIGKSNSNTSIDNQHKDEGGKQ
jgi:hypothetical protein